MLDSNALLSPEALPQYRAQTGAGGQGQPEALREMTPVSIYRATDVVPQAQGPSVNHSSVVDGFLVSRLIEAAKNQDAIGAKELVRQIEIQVKPVAGDTSEAMKLNEMGLTALNHKNYSEAVKMFLLAAKNDPADSQLFYNLGSTQAYLGDRASAEKSLTMSLLLAPHRGNTWLDLGKNFAKDGSKDNAVACFVLGYSVGDGKSTRYLDTLANSQDEVPSVIDAAKTALNQVSGIAFR